MDGKERKIGSAAFRTGEVCHLLTCHVETTSCRHWHVAYMYDHRIHKDPRRSTTISSNITSTNISSTAYDRSPETRTSDDGRSATKIHSSIRSSSSPSPPSSSSSLQAFRHATRHCRVGPGQTLSNATGCRCRPSMRRCTCRHDDCPPVPRHGRRAVRQAVHGMTMDEREIRDTTG